MILEERNYGVAVGAANRYLALWEEHGRVAQERILGDLRGVWVTEVGELNTIVYHWAFESFAERSRRRDQLMADPEFTKFRGLVRELMISQRTRILRDRQQQPALGNQTTEGDKS